jgi:hypothetical protein
VPSQPIRGPKQPSVINPTQPAEPGRPSRPAQSTESAEVNKAGQPTEPVTGTKPTGPLPSKRTAAKKASTAKKAAPAKKAVPVKKAAVPVKKATPAEEVASVEKAAPKATPSKKTAPVAEVPVKRPPVKKAVPEPSTPATVEELSPPTAPMAEVAPVRVAATVESDRRRFDSIGEQLLADPARTPEILANALVQAIGPRAQGWADHVRATYPTASRDALARLAVHRFTRAAGLRGGVGALAGPYTLVVVGAATVITHAELVLHLAAVYGLDPADPERAADLLRLASPGAGPVAGWAALSLTAPGVRLLAAFLSARTTTEMVAIRARRYYADIQAS